ncbi:MAG: hypothetical protein HOW73_49745 [Polyangiaceae bacterium]|nr:hypothetical protein [Polyangiaceae bacterium]
MPLDRSWAIAVALAVACDAPPPASSGDLIADRSLPPPQSEAPPSTSIASATAAPSASPPEPPEEPFAVLDVPDHEDAIVSVAKKGARRPLVVATHGNYDRPEWQCEVFRTIVSDSAFVLCPRGIQRPDSPSHDDVRFTYANNRKLEAEIDAARKAFEARYGDRLAPGPAIYAGFSLGAIMGVAILGRTKKGVYDRAVFVEGGYDRIDAKTARALADAGIVKVLIACGQAACLHSSKAKVSVLDKVGISTKAVGVKNAGHAYDGEVATAVREAWSWLVSP